MFPQMFGKYVLTREIAAGGMARVFLATLRGAGGFEKRLVVKQIRPELGSDQSFVERFVAEAKTTVELSHSNIVPVYELGAEQGIYYIAMEFCEGVSLGQLLVEGALSPAEGAYVGVEICRALDYAHRKAGIVHRDVTPRNVLVDLEGMVRLIDFGIAAPARTEAPGAEPLFGSPGHMPPEQLGRGPLTPAADVFAVAALLVELWTARAPFRRESFEASVRALDEPLPDLSASDPGLAALDPLIRTALARDPSARPQTAEELARPLREFLRSSDLGDIARRLGERVRQRATRPPAPPRDAADRRLSSAGSGATQSFAMRDALREWTAKIDSDRPREVAASLQTDPEAQPPSSGSGSEIGTLHARERRRWLRSASLLASCVLLAVLAFGALRAASSGRLPALEAAQARVPDTPAQSAVAAVAPAAPSVELPASRLAPPSIARVSEAEPSLLAGTSRPSTVANSSRAISNAVRAHSSAPEHVAASRAPKTRVQITAEPPALVRIDSALVGRTPLFNVGLAPGRHDFVFESEQLGERLEAKLSLEGPSRRVHADFTSATPQVHLR